MLGAEQGGAAFASLAEETNMELILCLAQESMSAAMGPLNRCGVCCDLSRRVFLTAFV